MTYIKYILLVILVFLSISTGLTKLIQMPEEMVLFGNAGFPDTLTILFGVVQIIGGVMLLLAKFRKLGAIIMTITFIIATIVVFVNEMLVFGIFSLLFIALSTYFIRNPSLNQSIK